MRKIISAVYYILFIPLMMLPIVGWSILIVLNNYKEKLDVSKVTSPK